MDKGLKSRLIILQLFFIVVFMFAIYRLVYINIYESEELKEAVLEEKILERVLPAKRGMILDRNGIKIAFSMYKYKITLNTKGVDDDELNDTISNLSEILSIPEEEIILKLENKKTYAVTIADIYDENIVNELKSKVNGGIVWIDKTEFRRYPNEKLLANVVGYTTYEDDGRTIQGMTGIEKEFNEYLKETDGLLITEKDKKNNELVSAKPIENKPIDGNNIVLTIDHVVQHYIENALLIAYEEYLAKAVHAIIMDVNNGDILGMGSYPTFNPNNINEIIDISDEEIGLLTKKEISDIYNFRFINHNISDRYELGSTIKLITAAIALELNLYTPDSTFDIGNNIDVADRNIKCWYYPHSHGEETLTQAVENSCNPVFVVLGRAIGRDNLYDYFEGFGLSERTGIDLPAEVNSFMQDIDTVNEVELATMTFGHGISNSQIQLVTAISAIVNGGYLLEPQIVKRIEDENGNVVLENEKVVKRQVISQITSSQMRDIMESVVVNGSGHAVYTDGIRIGAKTGTSEKFDVEKNEYSSEKAIASFIAVAPIDNPQIAVYILVDEPKGDIYGSLVAGPVAKSILDDVLPYLGIEKEFDYEDELIEVPSLIGLSYEDGVEIIEKLDLTIISSETEDFTRIITEQYPKAGMIVNKKSSIIIKFE